LADAGSARLSRRGSTTAANRHGVGNAERDQKRGDFKKTASPASPATIRRIAEKCAVTAATAAADYKNSHLAADASPQP
jgi:hypothetical protein